MSEHRWAALSGRTSWSAAARAPLRLFIRTESASAAVLLVAAVAALVWANVDAASYERVWRTGLAVRVGHWGFGLDARGWVNTGLMALWHPWTSYLIVPLFALANAGIPLSTHFLATAFTSPVTLGILVGYVVGKPVGITVTSVLVTAASRARLRPPVGWGSVLGAGSVAGIGSWSTGSARSTIVGLTPPQGRVARPWVYGLWV